MAMFRCYHCANEKGLPGKDFEAAKPVCPACGADKDLVAKVETIHFDPPSGLLNRGLRRAACDPKVTINTAGSVRMSGEPAAVTCRACKATDAYKLNAELWGEPEPAERAE